MSGLNLTAIERSDLPMNGPHYGGEMTGDYENLKSAVAQVR
jgi:hypothetical protein